MGVAGRVQVMGVACRRVQVMGVAERRVQLMGVAGRRAQLMGVVGRRGIAGHMMDVVRRHLVDMAWNLGERVA